MFGRMPIVGGGNSESKEEWDGIIAHERINRPFLMSSTAAITIRATGGMSVSSTTTNNYGHCVLFDVGKSLKDFNILSFTGYASGVYGITGVFVVQKSKLPSTISTTESIASANRIKVITLTTSNKTTTYALSGLSDEVRNDECYIVLSVATSTTTNYPMTFTDLSLIK